MSDNEQLDKPKSLNIDDDLAESVNSRTPLNELDGDEAYNLDVSQDDNRTNTQQTTTPNKELDEPLMTPSTYDIVDSHSNQNEDHIDPSSTPRTEHSQSIESLTNPLDTTKLRHQGDDIEVGVIDDDQQKHSPIVAATIPQSSSPEQRRMPRYA